MDDLSYDFAFKKTWKTRISTNFVVPFQPLSWNKSKTAVAEVPGLEVISERKSVQF